MIKNSFPQKLGCYLSCLILSVCFFFCNPDIAFPQASHIEKISPPLSTGDKLYHQGVPYTGVAVDFDGTDYNPKKVRFYGTYTDGFPDGKISKWYPDYKPEFEENYSYGSKNGRQVYYYPNGKRKSEQNYSMSAQDGIQTYWYETGAKEKEESYTMGCLVRSSEWYPDGTEHYTLNYVNCRKPDGEFSFKTKEGKNYQVIIHDGFINKETMPDKHYFLYYSNEQKKEEGTLNDNGQVDGVVRTWYENGNLKSEGVRLNGMLEGKFTEWKEDGKLSCVSEYRDDKLEGETVKYDDAGNKTIQIYQNGMLLKSIINNEENLVSRNRLSMNDYLFLCISGEKNDSSIIKVTIKDNLLGDQKKNELASAIMSAMYDRFRSITAFSDSYSRKYISYFYEISDLGYSTQYVTYQTKCIDKNFKMYNCTRSGYSGNCRYHLEMLDANRKRMFNNNVTFSTTDNTDLNEKYLQDANLALDKVIRRANSEYAVYHFFPLNGLVSELGKVKGDTRAKSVIISLGKDDGVFKGLAFNVYAGEIGRPGKFIATLTAEEVSPTSTVCKVTIGGEDLVSSFNNSLQVKIVSNR
jgi:antitoxin component YwqK of YwqJK toxin-antitoxin module